MSLIRWELAFPVVNANSGINPYYKQEKIARDHDDNILYALSILKHARTSEITKFVNKKVKSEIRQDYNGLILSSKDRKQIEDQRRIELKEKQLTRKTTRNRLRKLEIEGLVYSTKYFVYGLTEAGESLKIFPESYGKALFNAISEIPLKGTKEEDVLESVETLGLYIVYIFLRNSSPAVASSFYQASGKNDVSWIIEAINLRLMFDWFTRKVYSKNERFSVRSKEFIVMMDILESKFPRQFPLLMESEQKYYKEVFPEYYKKIILKKIKK